MPKVSFALTYWMCKCYSVCVDLRQSAIAEQLWVLLEVLKFSHSLLPLHELRLRDGHVSHNQQARNVHVSFTNTLKLFPAGAHTHIES